MAGHTQSVDGYLLAPLCDYLVSVPEPRPMANWSLIASGDWVRVRLFANRPSVRAEFATRWLKIKRFWIVMAQGKYGVFSQATAIYLLLQLLFATDPQGEIVSV